MDIHLKLQDILSTVLGNSHLENEKSNFMSLGGDSLSAVRIVSEIRNQLNLEIPAEILFQDGATFSQLETFLLEQRTHPIETINWKHECQLEDDFTSFKEEKSRSEQNQQRGIFLTGSTGFLGSFLLVELLYRTPDDVPIFCLVKPKKNQNGKQRLKESFQNYAIELELEPLFNRNKIQVVEGDLAAEWIGLGSKENFRNLAQKIDCIIHNGAWVHHLLPYSALKKTNVNGTKETLRLAFLSGKESTRYYFISSLSVIPVQVGERKESYELNDQQVLEKASGYAQTKWVAERLVMEASNKGLSTLIFRPGTICGHSITGALNVTDYYNRLMMTCVQLGKYPKQEEEQNENKLYISPSIQLCPVDFATKGIAYLISQQETKKCFSSGMKFHVIHPNGLIPFIDLFSFLSQSVSPPLIQVSFEEWNQEIQTKNTPLLPFRQQFKMGGTLPSSISADCTQFQKALESSGINCSAITVEMIKKFIEWNKRKS